MNLTSPGRIPYTVTPPMWSEKNGRKFRTRFRPHPVTPGGRRSFGRGKSPKGDREFARRTREQGKQSESAGARRCVIGTRRHQEDQGASSVARLFFGRSSRANETP